MNSVRFRALIALLLTVAPLVAGCGAATGSGPEGAAVAPASAFVFVSVDTDFSSSQWKSAQDLVDKFPDGQRAVDFLLRELSSNGVDFNEDVKPALGAETDVVGLNLSDQSEGSFVGLTKPSDPAKLKALLSKSDQTVVTRDIDGWTAFADSAAALDTFEKERAAGTLEGNADFQDAMSQVNDDGLVRAYINTAAVQKELQNQPQFFPGALPGGKIPSVAISASAESGGLRIEGAEKLADDQAGYVPDQFKADLPSEVPAGALVYLDFNDLGGAIKAFRDAAAQADPSFDRDLAQIESQIGVSLDDDVLPLFAGESALYVRQGFLIPEVTLVTHVEDEQKAMATVDKLVGALRQYVPNSPTARSTEIDGIAAKEVPISPPFSLFYAAFDGHLVLTTARDGIAALRSHDDRLSDDADFKKALEDAGVPDETSGFGYLNLKAGLPYALGFAGAVGGPISSQVSSNIEPLKSLVFYGAKDGSTLRFTAFLAVD
jgi:hypothetical protein